MSCTISILYNAHYSGSDGLVKVWTIKTNECVTTLDLHTEKVNPIITKSPSSQSSHHHQVSITKSHHHQVPSISACTMSSLIYFLTVPFSLAMLLIVLLPQIWALTGSLDDQWLVSGGADSLICQWKVSSLAGI